MDVLDRCPKLRKADAVTQQPHAFIAQNHTGSAE